MSIKKKRNARALAFTSPSLSKGLFIMVDGFFNLAAKSKLLFEGVASVLKIWVGVALILFPIPQLRTVQRRAFPGLNTYSNIGGA